MSYPHKLVLLQEGLSLYVPDNELVKTTYEHLKAIDADTTFPFWAKIWPSSKAMATFLQTESHYIEGMRVLEIGAGVGLPSFVIAQKTASITISDYVTDAVALIEKNIKYLGLTNTKAMCLDWHNFPDAVTADIIVLSDINYAPGDFEVLLHLIQRFLAQGSTVIIATPQRITASPFVEKLQPYIQRSVTQNVSILNEIVDISILVLAL